VLGYRNVLTAKWDRDRHLLARSADPRKLLPARPGGSWLRPNTWAHGTYLVLRQLEQDGHGFWRTLAEPPVQSRTARRRSLRADCVRGKLVGAGGRSGAPWSGAPERDESALAMEKRP